jgi:4-hydroxy-3-methylbut-2-en-1-yl diphosphate reductase
MSKRSDHEAVRPVFLAPLRIEQLAVRRGARRTRVERIGMGPANATAARARLTRELEPGRPIVLLGVAGALDAGLAAGDLVIARSVTGIDSEETYLFPEAAPLAARLERIGFELRLGDVVSVPRVLKGDVAREKAAASGAIVADMESLWMAPIARRHPFIIIRAVIDTVGRDVVSLSTPLAALRAFESVSRVARVLARWSPTSVRNYPLLEVGES